jgi:hypothetical protein
MEIFHKPTAAMNVVRAAIRRQPEGHPRFEEDMFPALWDAAVFNQVDPVGVVAQSWKETGGGNFTGNVRPEFNNTCGLKLRDEQRKLFPGITDNDHPLSHAMFATWEQGALAHVQHLIAYGGGLIPFREVVDPRYHLVAGRNELVHFSDLNGKWAQNNPTYGDEVEAIMRRFNGSTEG